MEGTPADGLMSYPYRMDRLAAVVPKDHALKGKTIPFAEIVRFDLVGLDSDTAMMRLLFEAAAALESPLRLRVEVASFEAVCKFVQAGMGIGVLPENAARNFAREMGLRVIKLSDPWASRRMFIFVRSLSSLPLAGRKLVELLVEQGPSKELVAEPCG